MLGAVLTTLQSSLQTICVSVVLSPCLYKDATLVVHYLEMRFMSQLSEFCKVHQIKLLRVQGNVGC